MAPSRARWRKVWADLWSTPSLMHLDYSSLYLLVFLIVHAEWQPGDESSAIVWRKNRVSGQKLLQKMARMQGRVFTRCLDALIAEECVTVDATGIHLPNYGKWQETADAARKRKQRVGLSKESPSPSPSPSPSDQKEDARAIAAQIPTRQNPRAGTDIAILAQWRTYGGDTEGLGPWPTPITPDGTTLPQLTIPTRLCEVIQSGRTAEQVHRLVHTLGAMVEAGALPKQDHRGSYVFSGHYEGFEQRALDWQAAQARKAEEAAQAELSRPAELTAEEKANLVF
jgi:hypothetical protein